MRRHGTKGRLGGRALHHDEAPGEPTLGQAHRRAGRGLIALAFVGLAMTAWSAPAAFAVPTQEAPADAAAFATHAEIEFRISFAPDPAGSASGLKVSRSAALGSDGTLADPFITEEVPGGYNQRALSVRDSGSASWRQPGRYYWQGYTKTCTGADCSVSATAVRSFDLSDPPPSSAPSQGAPGSGGSTGTAPSTVPLTGADLISPPSGAEFTSPSRAVFSWTPHSQWGGSHDRVRIQRENPDGSTSNLIDVTSVYVRSYAAADGVVAAAGKDFDLADLATFNASPSAVAVQIREPLPPARYSWFVLRGSGDINTANPGATTASERRFFTVRGPKLTQLHVTAASRRGGSSSRPGQTTFRVTTNPFVSLTVRLAGGAHVQSLALRADGHGRLQQPYSWSCNGAGTGLRRLTVTARDQDGGTMTRAIRFKIVSAAECRAMKQAEAAKRRAASRRRAAAEREEAREEADRQRRRERRFRRNCRAVGGIPRTIETGSGFGLICASIFGGTLYVPGF